MTDFSVIFTETDHKILNSYRQVLDGLADYLGEGYELVLHSLNNLESSVIKIVNGHYTGRKEGSPITDLGLQMLAKTQDEHTDYISYFNKGKHNKNIKCSTITIRGEGGKIIGLLCINFYLDTPFADLLKAYIPPDKQKIVKEENFSSNVEELISLTVGKVRDAVMADETITPANKNKEIVIGLHDRGLFNLKDAVIRVAELLGVSKNTIYMHLRNLKDHQ
ncbi:conserved hypothetical protein [uncultured delta proteobacterium]|uniref:YheO domain protein n=1 Tax=uncultured delta proteobacterium TaxID=34034 RepID=A0A212IYF7_9DELT|nr:conserved hypothetical protein [uncultured delta proteobacterium]